MKRNRLEAFSDGVLAIIITIMVLDVKVPAGHTFAELGVLWPTALSYLLSFIYVGVYWNNHHHMLSTCRRVNGTILWANLNLLFWLSLFPVATNWAGTSLGQGSEAMGPPMALYGVVLLLAALAYWLLQAAILRAEGPNSVLQKAVGPDWKGKLSPIAYLIAVAFSFGMPKVSAAIYVLIALVWIVPDARIERVLGANGDDRHNGGEDTSHVGFDTE